MTVEDAGSARRRAIIERDGDAVRSSYVDEAFDVSRGRSRRISGGERLLARRPPRRSTARQLSRISRRRGYVSPARFRRPLSPRQSAIGFPRPAAAAAAAAKEAPALAAELCKYLHAPPPPCVGARAATSPRRPWTPLRQRPRVPVRCQTASGEDYWFQTRPAFVGSRVRFLYIQSVHSDADLRTYRARLCDRRVCCVTCAPVD